MTRRLFPCPDVSDELPIALRAYVESAGKGKKRRRRGNEQRTLTASEWSLVFDTETTTDPGQALRVGFCRIYYRDELRRHVLFYDADILSASDLKIVKRYAKSAGIELMTREEFIDGIFYKYGYHLRAMIIGFNLPFDLSRLAVSHALARTMMRGGFSLKLSPLNYQPPAQVKHLSKYVSMIRFAAPFMSPNSRSQLKHGKKNSHKRGYFLEVRALAAALLSRSFTLASLAEFLGIFPVRAQYNDGADGTIGANYLSGKVALWFTLADCLAAQLLAKKPVKVIKALIFKPGPPQSGLKPVAISGISEYLVDPYKDDFYKRMIELRNDVKGQRAKSTGAEYVKFDVEQNAIKIAANATSYGIFAEVNVNDRAKDEATRIYPATSPSYVINHIKDEQPGRYFHPLLATTITGTARLMLAICERLILDEGLDWAFCDTDSMAIAKPLDMPDAEFHKKVDRIVGWFESLNPYFFPGSILKIEKVNYSLENPKIRRPLFVWAVSAKRYALFNIENGQPVIRKASAHGLGHLQAPYDENNPAKGIPAPKAPLSDIGVKHWHHDLWWLITKSAVDCHPDDVKLNFHLALKKPAASQYAATTPKHLRWFDKYNDGISYARKLKPFGFVSVFSARALIDEPRSKLKSAKSSPNAQLRPVSPFDKNPVIAANNAFDRITRKPVSIEHLKTYQQALAQYHLHPEDKFLNGDFLDRGMTIRRHVRVTEIEYIGKESNKWEDQYYFGFDPDEEIHYGSKPPTAATLSKAVLAIVDAHGLRVTAQELRISRAKLSKLLENEFAGCKTAFLQRISRIVSGVNSRRTQEINRKSKLLRLAKSEIERYGLAKFAAAIGVDQSNLSKTIDGRRRASDTLMGRISDYFPYGIID